jgi:LDH2 family malate/lactate/ureidoglycolate dehydrogenase
MNRPPDQYLLVAEERHLSFLRECFVRAGLEPDHAGLISRLLANSELRGVRSHGIGWAPGYCRGLKEGRLNPRPQIRVAHQTAAAVVLDGDGTLGYLPMTRATELAIGRAKQTGIGLGLVRHIGHYGAAGHYGRMCLDQGCVGFTVQGFRNDGQARREPKPSIAFTGAPPMCFAVPAGEEPPIVLDMVAHALSGYSGDEYADLPERIPAAFFKSMGLVAVATLLGGGLTGFTLPEADALLARWPGATMGGTVVAIDVASLLPAEAFRAEVDRYVRAIRESYAPLPGFDRSLLPGAVEEEVAALHREQGIRFGESEQQAARQLHEYLGVPLPWD